MRLGGFCVSILLVLSAVFGAASEARSSAIGNWDKSSRSWNNTHMTRIKAAMIAAGHRVDPDSPITAASLKTAVYVFGEPTITPTAAELDLLRRFIRDGGTLMVFGDTGIDLASYNSLLASVGSTITFIPTTVGTSSALLDGQFTRAPTRIVGGSLTVTSGNGTAGGTLIDNNYARFEQIGSGYVLTFGDRIDHNDVISDTNTSLLLNAVSLAIGPVFQVPALSPWMLILLALLACAFAAGRLRLARASA